MITVSCINAAIQLWATTEGARVSKSRSSNKARAASHPLVPYKRVRFDLEVLHSVQPFNLERTTRNFTLRTSASSFKTYKSMPGGI